MPFCTRRAEHQPGAAPNVIQRTAAARADHFGGSATSMLILGATSALAGVGVGAVFNMGKTNKVNATSTVTGSATGTMLKVVNSGTGTAAAFSAPAGKPPFTVNSATEVANLNAATVDGRPSTDFYAAGSTVANSNQLGGHTPADFYAAGSTVADSSKLGGQPSSAFGDRWFAVLNTDHEFNFYAAC